MPRPKILTTIQHLSGATQVLYQQQGVYRVGRAVLSHQRPIAL